MLDVIELIPADCNQLQNTAVIDAIAESVKSKVPFITGPYAPDKKRGPRIRRVIDPSKALKAADADVKSPWVKVRAKNVEALGVRGAVILDWLNDWYLVNRTTGKAKLRVTDCEGRYWVAASFEEIKAATGFKKYDAECGIKAVMDAGVLETTVMPYTKAKTRKLHLRLIPADGASSLPHPIILTPKASEAKLAEPLKNDSQVDGPTLVGGAKLTGQLSNTTSPISTSQMTNNIVEPVPKTPGTKTVPHPVTKGKANPKTEPTPTPPVALAPPSKQPLAIAVEWERATGDHLDPEEAKCLKDGMNEITAAGMEWRTVLQYWFANRGAVMWSIDPRDSRSDSLERPRVGYFVAHLPEIMAMMKPAAPQPTQQASKPTPLPKPIPSSTKPHSAPLGVPPEEIARQREQYVAYLEKRKADDDAREKAARVARLALS